MAFFKKAYPLKRTGMEKEKFIFTSNQDTKGIQLPGTTALPDGTKPIKLGTGNITRLISAGGMAIVYEIWNAELEVKRAVKLLKPDHTQESEDRFHTEMKISAKLHHPNIVEIYTVGKWQDLPYIEMELVDGITLETLIAQAGSLPPEVCTSVAIMVGRALNYAHSQNYMLYGKRYQGVIHRDLKPGNIMVPQDGVVKLMDFGIAKPMTASIHTMDGVIMGTMQYLAPEQLDGKEIDARSDIYALGVVLYEMLTGTQAFGEQNLGKLVTDKLNNNYIPLTYYRAKIPSSLCSLVHRCIRFEKEKRLQNVLEFLRTVCRIHKTLTIKPPEQVIEQLIKEPRTEKRIVPMRKTARFSPALLWTCAAVALITVASYVMLSPIKLKIFRMFQFHAVMAAPPAKANASAASIVSRVDSILALQKHSGRILAIRHATINDQPVNDDRSKAEAKHAYQLANKNRSAKKIGRQKEAAAPLASKNTAGTLLKSGTNPDVLSPPPSDQGNAEKKLSLIEKLRRQLRTNDVMTMFCKEVEAGHFSNALELYASLPSDDASSKKVKIYRLRALLGQGRADEVKNTLLSNDVYDGEFYLEKSRYFYGIKDVMKAEEYVKRASVTPSQYLDQRAYRELLLYSKALCASALYDATPTAQTKKDAVESWVEVKSLFRTNPDHKYFQKADAEIRRINTAVAAK